MKKKTCLFCTQKKNFPKKEICFNPLKDSALILLHLLLLFSFFSKLPNIMNSHCTTVAKRQTIGTEIITTHFSAFLANYF